MIKLYYAVNTCSLASHIALEEAGATYTTVQVSFASNEQRGPEYLAINPKGRVLAMVTDRGILTETRLYRAELPRGAPGAARRPLRLCRGAGVQQLSVLDGACRACAPDARPALADDPAAIAAMQRKVPQSVGACFELIERDMLKGPWVMGEAYDL